MPVKAKKKAVKPKAKTAKKPLTAAQKNKKLATRIARIEAAFKPGPIRAGHAGQAAWGVDIREHPKHYVTHPGPPHGYFEPGRGPWLGIAPGSKTKFHGRNFHETLDRTTGQVYLKPGAAPKRKAKTATKKKPKAKVGTKKRAAPKKTLTTVLLDENNRVVAANKALASAALRDPDETTFWFN